MVLRLSGQTVKTKHFSPKIPKIFENLKSSEVKCIHFDLDASVFDNSGNQLVFIINVHNQVYRTPQK